MIQVYSVELCSCDPFQLVWLSGEGVYFLSSESSSLSLRPWSLSCIYWSAPSAVWIWILKLTVVQTEELGVGQLVREHSLRCDSMFRTVLSNLCLFQLLEAFAFTALFLSFSQSSGPVAWNCHLNLQASRFRWWSQIQFFLSLWSESFHSGLQVLLIFDSNNFCQYLFESSSWNHFFCRPPLSIFNPKSAPPSFFLWYLYFQR